MSEWQHLYNSKQWKHNRGKQLFREPRCVMCLAMNRQTPANEVDHIIPHKGDVDLFFDVNNYQSLCKSCHSRKTWYENKNIRINYKYLPKGIKPKSKNITLLFGAPCSGRADYANKQDTTVVNLDAIKAKVSGQNPYDMSHNYLQTCIMVRNDLIKSTKGDMIVIGSLPNPEIRMDWITKLKAEPMMMITPMHECIRRLKLSGRPNIRAQVSYIRKWFNEFKPLGNEGFING